MAQMSGDGSGCILGLCLTPSKPQSGVPEALKIGQRGAGPKAPWRMRLE